eukprot:2782933-Prymnesium_polylepis.3
MGASARWPTRAWVRRCSSRCQRPSKRAWREKRQLLTSRDDAPPSAIWKVTCPNAHLYSA